MNIQNTLMAPVNDLSAIGPIQGITIIVPDRSHVSLASVFRDFFISLDQFTNAETPRDLSVYTLDSCPSHDQAYWRNRTVVFWADFHARWKLDNRQLSRAHQLLRLSRQCVLVGGGVFVLCKSVFASRTALAVHSNLRFVAEEEGLFCIDGGAPFAIDGRICSATSIFAALRLFLKLLEAEMGGFSAATFGDYVGLEVSGEPFHGKQEHIIKRYSGGDRIIGDCVAVMLEHLENTLSIVQIAPDHERILAPIATSLCHPIGGQPADDLSQPAVGTRQPACAADQLFHARDCSRHRVRHAVQPCEILQETVRHVADGCPREDVLSLRQLGAGLHQLRHARGIVCGGGPVCVLARVFKPDAALSTRLNGAQKGGGFARTKGADGPVGR